MLPLAAPFILEQSISGAVSPREGNRHPMHAPHGCYRCAGEDAWIVLSVTDDEQWRALCRLIGREGLAADARLANAPGRRAQHDSIDAAMRESPQPFRAHQGDRGVENRGAFVAHDSILRLSLQK